MISQIKNDILFLSGSISLADVTSFLPILQEYIHECQSRAQLDLSAIETIDICGLQLLISAKKTAKLANKAFEITAMSPSLAETFILLGLDSIFQLDLAQ